MSGPIQRPEFYEGEVLGAADLNSGVDYARNQLARHERYLHEWGIATGLTLTVANKQLMIRAGVAIDGTGREIVVDSDSVVDTPFTQTQNVNDTKTWFPVFLIGKDAEAAATTTLTGSCNSAQSTRINERWQIEFGNPGDEQGLDDQPGSAGPTSAPDGGATDQNPWKILVGFVQYDPSGPAISAAQDSSPNSSVTRRYAGVQADDVRARGSKLTLETSGGANNKPQLTIDETNGAELDFRPIGAPDPLFNIDAQGNLTIAGKFKTAVNQPPVSVSIESGTISDGALLPLPPGVTQAAVQNGDVTLHVQLTPRLFPPSPPPDLWWPLTAQCFADATGRVSCGVAWVLLTAAGPTTPSSPQPGACDYVVTAVFPPSTR